MKDKLVGVIVTIVSSAVMFMTYSYFGSFETKAASDAKFYVINKKIDLVLCYLDKKHCIKE